MRRVAIANRMALLLRSSHDESIMPVDADDSTLAYRGTASPMVMALAASDDAGRAFSRSGRLRSVPVMPTWDETQSSAPMPNSRLLSAEGHVCPHTAYVRASQTTRTNLCLSVAESSGGTRITTSAACTTSSASGLGNSCEMSIPSPPGSQESGRRSDLRRDGASGRKSA